jgi:hypothetical protein
MIRASTLAAALVSLAAATSACASQPPTSQPSPAPRTVAVVHLTASYSPGILRLKAGQQFLLIVSSRIQASIPGGGGLLTARRLAAGRCLYTAHTPGIITLPATIRPRCQPGTACPQWVSVALLRLTIT